MGETLTTTTIDPMIAKRVQQFCDEATTGPHLGGIAEELRIAGVTVELAASRDWGVQATRTMPDGQKLVEKVEAADATLANVGAALGRLVRTA